MAYENYAYKTRIRKKCGVCGKKFLTIPAEVKRGKGKFCSNECRHRFRSITYKGAGNIRFKGGYLKSGYRMIFSPNNKSCDKTGHVREHVMVIEKTIGRKLKSNECVHHINFDKLDNRPENLVVMEKRKHLRFHNALWRKRVNLVGTLIPVSA